MQFEISMQSFHRGLSRQRVVVTRLTLTRHDMEGGVTILGRIARMMGRIAKMMTGLDLAWNDIKGRRAILGWIARMVGRDTSRTSQRKTLGLQHRLP